MAPVMLSPEMSPDRPWGVLIAHALPTTLGSSAWVWEPFLFSGIKEGSFAVLLGGSCYGF